MHTDISKRLTACPCPAQEVQESITGSQTPRHPQTQSSTNCDLAGAMSFGGDASSFRSLLPSARTPADTGNEKLQEKGAGDSDCKDMKAAGKNPEKRKKVIARMLEILLSQAVSCCSILSVTQDASPFGCARACKSHILIPSFEPLHPFYRVIPVMKMLHTSMTFQHDVLLCQARTCCTCGVFTAKTAPTYCTCVIQLFHAHDALRTFDPLMARASRLLVITRTSCCASWTRVSAKRQIAYSLEQTDMLERFFFDGELDTKMVQLQHLHHNPSTPRH